MSDKAQRDNMGEAPLGRGALVVLSPAINAGRAYAALGRASFISQLIAERQHLPPQRERRRATVSVAVESYAETERQAVLRLPPGYRKTLVV